MTYKARISPAAQEDIHQAAQWYNNQKTGLGKQLRYATKKFIRPL